LIGTVRVLPPDVLVLVTEEGIRVSSRFQALNDSDMGEYPADHHTLQATVAPQDQAVVIVSDHAGGAGAA
jgi:hypothetical protein